MGVTLITQRLLWDCLGLDVCVCVRVVSKNGRLKTNYSCRASKLRFLIRPVKRREKKGKLPPLEHCASAKKKKENTQCLASVGHSGAALVLPDGQEREMKAVLWKGIKKK